MRGKIHFTCRADVNLRGLGEDQSAICKVPKILRYYSLEPTNLSYEAKFFVDVIKDFKMGGIMPEQWGRPQASF